MRKMKNEGSDCVASTNSLEAEANSLLLGIIVLALKAKLTT